MERRPEKIDWSGIERTRRTWLRDVGGDHGARLGFLADQGLRLVMADIGPGGEETLHFSNPRDRETLHLGAEKGERLLSESERYFPEAGRWIELLKGTEAEDHEGGFETVYLERGGLLLEMRGGRVRLVREIEREYTRGDLYGVRAREAGHILARRGGAEGAARGIAFMQALEEARGMEVPDAPLALRAAFLEIARVYSHLLWMSRVSAVLGRQGVAERCLHLCRVLEEQVMGWLDDPLGTRWCVPGGIMEDFPVREAPGMAERLAPVAEEWRELSPAALSVPVPGWVEKRLRQVSGDMRRDAWVGPLARAGGLERDAREEEPGAYDAAGWRGAVPSEGRGLLRRMLEIKVLEVRSSLELARGILADLPDGRLLVKRGRGGRGEGFGRCEGPEGEVCCHLVLERGRVGYLALSLPYEVNRSAARSLAGVWMDEVEVLSLLWESPH